MSLSDDLLNDAFIDLQFITRDCDLSTRAVQKQIARGVFPPPDANLHGRNVWRRSTYANWKRDVLAGKFAKTRMPGRSLVDGPRVA